MHASRRCRHSPSTAQDLKTVFLACRFFRHSNILTSLPPVL
ncbi:MAG: hypothetical protein OJF52_002509 [Nitrospira sp.]|nr:MAG: hypothetical protein OJF52_002509 [Nitrospira sp.]